VLWGAGDCKGASFTAVMAWPPLHAGISRAAINNLVTFGLT